MAEQQRRQRELFSQAPWTLSADATLEALGVDPEAGLTAGTAAERREEYGPNRLRTRRRKSAWKILLDQFASLIIGLLGLAAAMAMIFGKWVEGLAIAVALLLNAVIGFVTELKAVRSMEALQRLGTSRARVYRDGESTSISAADLVPGDIVVLEGGDVIPADLRVIETNNLQVDESALTGESVPVAKKTDPVGSEAPLAGRSNMLYKGTAVTAGSGAGVVVATGMGTELGSIASLAQAAGEEFTPLERRLERLGRKLVWATLAAGVVVAGAGIVGGKDLLLVLETAIAMAVAAVPEGLPIVATIALARGMWRMARRNALVNRLSAVETLGATTVICTDKTGTLTENRMRLARLELAEDGLRFAAGAPESEPAEGSPAMRALRAGVLCNNASLGDGTATTGDPLEIALLAAGAAVGLERDGLLERWPEKREEAFATETRMMATVHAGDEGFLVAVKGAPEAVLEACSRVATPAGEQDLDDAARRQWTQRNRQLAEEGLRVIGLAERGSGSAADDPYRDLTLLALAGLWDPPREAVREVLEECRRSGIRVIMVTGDHPATARAVAAAVGLGGDAPTGTGEELDAINDLGEEQRAALLATEIFARVSPAQKLGLIRLHQEAGDIVAMTGDGVNDAPALEKADIGVAMGRRGTQVARDAADMVLKDDELGTIVLAVRYGRVIFRNIRQFIFFLLSGNVSEILIITLAALVNAPLPLLPLQILYLNLIGDVFPALALGVGEGDEEVMNRPPRDPDEAILTRGHWLGVVGYALLIGASVLGGFALALTRYDMGAAEAVTVSFLGLSLARLWHVFNMRETGSSFWRNEITRNLFVWLALLVCLGLLALALAIPGLREILGLAMPTATGWRLIVGISLVPLLGGQLVKFIRGRRLVARAHG